MFQKSALVAAAGLLTGCDEALISRGKVGLASISQMTKVVASESASLDSVSGLSTDGNYWKITFSGPGISRLSSTNFNDGKVLIGTDNLISRETFHSGIGRDYLFRVFAPEINGSNVTVLMRLPEQIQSTSNVVVMFQDYSNSSVVPSSLILRGFTGR